MSKFLRECHKRCLPLTGEGEWVKAGFGHVVDGIFAFLMQAVCIEVIGVPGEIGVYAGFYPSSRGRQTYLVMWCF